MLEDGTGNLWVGTQNGLNYFDFKKQTFEHYNDKKEHGIGITGIGCISMDVHKNIWVGTTDGLYWLDSKTHKFYPYTAQFNNTWVGSIEFTDKGLYVLTAYGLYFKAYNSSDFSLIGVPENTKRQKDFNLRTLIKDKNGLLWIGTSNGLFYIDESKNNTLLVEQPFLKDELIHIFQQKNDEALWLCTKTGLYHFNLRTASIQKYVYNPFFPQNFPKNELKTAGYTSSNNIFWAQNKEQVMYFVDMNKPKFQNVPINLMENIPYVPDLHELYEYSPNHLWIPQKNGTGLLDINTGQIEPFIYAPDYNLAGWQKGVICFFEENDRKLWIGTEGGIFLFDKTTKRFTNLEAQIKGFDLFGKTKPQIIPRRIYRDKQGFLWIVTWSHGVFKVNFNNKTIKNYLNLEQDNIEKHDNGRSILEAQNGTIWVGTRGGLGKYMPEGDSFKIYKNVLNDPESMSENTAFCLYEDKNNVIWMGTYGGGLNKLDVKTEKFTHFTTENGLLDNNVFSILADKNDKLWLMGYKGLSVFDLKTLTFNKIYKKQDGLINSKYDAFLYGKSGYSDRFFFGGNEGIDFFNPDSITLSSFDPNIWLTDFKLFNTSVPLSKGEKNPKQFMLDEHIAFTKHLTLTYSQNVVAFEFAALDFSAPKNCQYAYILTGFDKDTQFIGTQRSATFTNLNPGDYTFTVKATNADGVWGTKTATLKLTILAPWWQTWWFRSLIFLLLCTLITAFYAYRFKQLKAREALTKRIAEVKMEALRAQMNPHFIFNALTSINLFVLKNDTDKASYYLNKFSKLMRDVLDNSRSELITVDEEINTLKLYLDIEKMRFKDNFNYSFNIHPDAPIEDVKIPPLIIQPYVENAIWHGLKHKKEGEAVLKITVSEADGYFNIVVEDNGIGRQQAMAIKKSNGQQHTSHGLSLTEERIEYFNETHGVESTLETIDLKDANEKGIGTKIIFKIKM